MKTRLAIFDFDGTLKDTHDNVDPSYLADLRFSEDPEEIRSYAGRSVSWLSSAESVNRAAGGDPWIEPVVEEARAAIEDPSTLSVLMTARNLSARDVILNSLQSDVGLDFEVNLFKTSDRDPVTGKYITESPSVWKAKKTAEILESEPGITRVDVYEDSAENLEAIRQVIPPGVQFVPHLESTRREERLARKATHKMNLDALNKQRKQFYAERGIDIAALTRSLREPMNEWRSVGDPPLPGNFNKGAPKRRRAPHDATYGNEPDMLDRPGVIVEPDVRKKISDYFSKMKLREFIRDCLKGV